MYLLEKKINNADEQKIGKRKEEKLLVTFPLKDYRTIFGVYISNVFPVYVYTHTHTQTLHKMNLVILFYDFLFTS